MPPFEGNNNPPSGTQNRKFSTLTTGSASIVPKSDRLRENINIPDRKTAIPNSSTDKSQARQNQSVKT
jgi:hypothetical protein